MVIGFVVHGSSCCFCLRFYSWHRHGFAVCTSLFLQLCILCAPCVGMYASPRYVTIPTPPTHPPQPKGMCVCAYSWECMQVQGMLPSPPHPPTHPNPKVCVCVRTVGNACKFKVCCHPFPTHPPTPTQNYVCVCTDESNLCAQMSPHPLLVASLLRHMIPPIAL